MKVLALNGSQCMRASSTFHMLQPLLEGMEAAGAETAVETGSVTGEEALKNCHDTIAGMANVFNPGVAGEMVADVQFNVSGAEPGTYYLQINNGSFLLTKDVRDMASEVYVSYLSYLASL